MQITPRVHALRVPFRVPTGPATGIDRFVYAFVVLGRRTWLVDTGVAGAEQPLLALVNELGRSAADVAHVLLTHGHVDHVGSAKALCALTRASVHAHLAEDRWIEDVETQARERPVPGFHSLVAGSVRIDEALVDGQRLELAADLHLRVIHTPGHSPGSTSFLLEEEGVLFSGDAVPVVGDMPVWDDPVLSLRSLERLLNVAGVRVMLASWDEPRHGAEARATIERAIELIHQVHRAVFDVAESSSVEPVELCRHALPKLGLPAAMANPLVARTVLGHLRLRPDALETL